VWSSGQRYGPGDHHLRIGQVGSVLDKKVIVAWRVALTLLTRCLSLSLVLPGFQGGCKLITGENSSEQRTQIQNGVKDAKHLSCF
jgi:hypothetical protein